MGGGVTRLIQGGVTSAQGFVAAGVHCGIKPQKKDLALVVSRVPAVAAGVFTTNKAKAAPVLVNMERIRSGQGRAVLLSRRNANDCTGEQGVRDARERAHLVAQHLQIPEELVYVCSTGPIGVPLPMEAIRRGVPEAVRLLGPDGIAAAEAILTTDTGPKAGAGPGAIGQHGGAGGGGGDGGRPGRPPVATTRTRLATGAAGGPPHLAAA